jgi:hypothetical protein
MQSQERNGRRVEIFRTNILDSSEAEHIVATLRHSFPEWSVNVDLDDCDKILRVEGIEIVSPEVENFVRKLGYDCTII